MGYSVYFWGDLVFLTDTTASWRGHKPDGNKWNDWTGDFEGEEPPGFKAGRTVDELCAGFPVFENRGIGYISISIDPHHAEIHGQFGEDTFRSHAREIAYIFRSAADFNASGEMTFLTDEGDAYILRVESRKSRFEKSSRQEIDDEGYYRICREIDKEKTTAGAASPQKPSTPAKPAIPKLTLPKEYKVLLQEPVKVFEKMGRLPGPDAKPKEVEHMRTLLDYVAQIAEVAFDGKIESFFGPESKDIFATEPRWYDLCLKAFRDKRFSEAALAAIKYHPDGVLFIVKNMKKLGDAGVNALYDCYINGPKGRLPMDLLNPLLPLAKENKDLAVFLEKAAKRVTKKKK